MLLPLSVPCSGINIIRPCKYILISLFHCCSIQLSIVSHSLKTKCLFPILLNFLSLFLLKLIIYHLCLLSTKLYAHYLRFNESGLILTNLLLRFCYLKLLFNMDNHSFLFIILLIIYFFKFYLLKSHFFTQ